MCVTNRFSTTLAFSGVDVRMVNEMITESSPCSLRLRTAPVDGLDTEKSRMSRGATPASTDIRCNSSALAFLSLYCSTVPSNCISILTSFTCIGSVFWLIPPPSSLSRVAK